MLCVCSYFLENVTKHIKCVHVCIYTCTCVHSHFCANTKNWELWRDHGRFQVSQIRLNLLYWYDIMVFDLWNLTRLGPESQSSLSFPSFFAFSAEKLGIEWATEQESPVPIGDTNLKLEIFCYW